MKYRNAKHGLNPEREFKRYEGSLRTIGYRPFFILKHIWIQLLILIFMFLICAYVFQYYQGLDWLTALLASVSTITTIGIYAPNIVNMAGTEKISLIIIFIVAVGSAASLLQGTLSAVLSKEGYVEEIDEVKAQKMREHVIVMGYSFMGKYVTENLKQLGIDSVILTKDEEQTQLAQAKGNIAFTAPVTHSFEALEKASIKSARAIVITYDDDGDNMLAVMSAKKLNPTIKIITIVNNRELIDGAKAAQADTIISPPDLIGQILAISAVSNKLAGAFISDKLGFRGISEFEIKKKGIKLGALEHLSKVLLILRKDELMSNVGGEFLLEQGDRVYLLADNESVIKLRAMLEEEEKQTG